MDDTRINTVAQLDAALAAQREQRIAKLRRVATLPFHWLLLLALLGTAFNLGAYIMDRQTSSLVNALLMAAMGLSFYYSVREKRLRAQTELENELQGQG
jgi:hypothetical protein